MFCCLFEREKRESIRDAEKKDDTRCGSEDDACAAGGEGGGDGAGRVCDVSGKWGTQTMKP